MPQYLYPLLFRFQRRGIASPSYPLEISDSKGKTLFIAREKFKWFQANTFHVFTPERAGKNDPDLFQMLPITEKGLDRGARFIESAKQQPIGKITQRRRQKLVQMDISDERDQRLFTVADNMSQRWQAMMMAFLKGGVNEVLATAQPLRFTQPGQSVGFELQPTDNHGSLQLTLSAPETTREIEICVVLGVTVLMYWWESDRSS